ncbi:hypothetical protein NPIL_506661 [Nephila pilipes]|uniref:Uncharacterized protein n=1 Tax=Nephila pilipes TaxID=299642 RepID=A0A8X6UAA3_NEPPI|nr:hypothetical protein NPIL_506661 [Nephila pilipes]
MNLRLRKLPDSIPKLSPEPLQAIPGDSPIPPIKSPLILMPPCDHKSPTPNCPCPENTLSPGSGNYRDFRPACLTMGDGRNGALAFISLSSAKRGLFYSSG